MEIKNAPTADLLRMLVSRDARKREWERDPGTWGGYSDSSDELKLDDVVGEIAERIDLGRAK